MPEIHPKIAYLYNSEKLSMQEIANKLNISIWSVVYQMRKTNIKRRDRFEVQRLRFENKKPSFNQKLKLNKDEEQLKIIASMLYWAEGVKRGSEFVDFVNSDANMIQLFLKSLRNIYQIDESKLRVLLYCYKNQNPNELIEYWSKTLNINRDQFTKPYIRENYDPKNIGRMKYGVIHLRYHDKKLLLKIMDEVDIIKRKFDMPRWLSGQKHETVDLAPQGYLGPNPSLGTAF